MKPALPTLLWVLLTAGTFAADGTPAGPATPQPRVRLVQTPARAARRVDPTEAPASQPAVVMNKFVVRDSPLVEGAPQPVKPEPRKFSLLDGGPLYSGKLGSLPFDVGLWTPTEIMPETAKFRPQQTRVEFGFLRLKF